MNVASTTEARDSADSLSPTMETRERILYETWRMLEARPGRSPRLEDIAKAAGVSRQAIYLHFGSRTELFIQTARYVDEHLNLLERMQDEVCNAPCEQAILAYVNWWANYIPDIHGLARALLALREEDEAAAAAWNDRMQAFHDGCLQIMQTITQADMLAPGWTMEQAADYLWALLSIDTWERLTIDRGWSKAQYIERMQLAATHALTRQPEC